MGEVVKFYYCKKCKKGIETKYSRCDGPDCNKRFIREPSYTWEEIEEFIRRDTALEETAQSDEQMDYVDENASGENPEGELICPKCGKRYDYSVSMCSCGSVLETYYESVEINEEPVQSGDGELYGKVLDNPSWKLLARRYAGNTPYDGNKEIILNRTITSIGLIPLAKNHIFSYDVREYRNLIGKVSRYNAFFMVENGKLYVQYDTVEHVDCKKTSDKAPIFINGILLQENQRYQLTDEDSVIMGNGADHNLNGCVEFIIKKIKRESQLSDAAVETITSMIGDLGEKMDHSGEMQRQILEKSNEIKDSVDKLSEIQIEKFSNVQTYLQSLEKFEAKYKEMENSKSNEEYVSIFLKDYKNKEALLSSLSEAQLDYLTSAAFYENMAMEHGSENTDYSAAFLYLGKLLENFAFQILAPLVEKYDERRWEFIGPAIQDKSVKLSQITRSFVFTDKETGELKASNRIIMPMIRDYLGVDERGKINQDELNKMRRSFVSCDKARGTRNESAHSSLDAVLLNQMKRVSKVDYLQAKKDILRSDFFVNIYKYYNKLIKK